MIFRKSKFILLVFFGLLFINNSFAQNGISEQHIKVAMRMIGHELLLQFGDSTSSVLPITKVENRYKISFDTEFQFDPTNLIESIEKVMTKAEIKNNYLVEVEKCGQKEVFYSYEIKHSVAKDLLPCGGRVLPKTCYNVLVTIQENSLSTAFSTVQKETNFGSHVLLFFFAFAIIIIGMFLINRFTRKNTSTESNPIISHNSNLINNHKINIGRYEFDTQRMELTFDNSTAELTSKEADLLLFLHQNANEIVEREQILKAVWGDEGDYIGRTLDVFISKLRKRLNADENVKIMNIRGVGYKLVIPN
jgi:DNA-binding winged helix-turn-helix (wHTH) protein